MNAQERLQAIIDDLANSLNDAEKFDKGNAVAGTRLRKACQVTKNSLQELRIHVQSVKTARKS